ncbi:unnamed protein product [Lupinus luteus]|uniref:Reverse transcriptase zinc-binding domain-containing protein n=1 Tax=Lupinus luteus TaxID=3873 RepID=A0AAV1W9L4_LUPLU
MSVLINGTPSSQFSVSRGIRQGDPMAPFMFLMVAEGFAGLVRQARNVGLLDGYKIGKYVVKSAYFIQLESNILPSGNILLKSWTNCVSSKICCFVWKLLRCRLPSKMELFKRQVIQRVEDLKCFFCNSHVESIDHLFLFCTFSSAVWKRFYSWLQVDKLNPASVLESLLLHEVINHRSISKDLWRMFWFSVVWSI